MPVLSARPGESVVIALSGGVDSAVAALLLAREGGTGLRGLFMKNWEGDDRPGHCAAEQDVADALAVCERLDIELNTVNLAGRYYEDVFRPFLEAYAAGRTPNPDVECNRLIKFKAFLEHCLEAGAGQVATGHYARIRRTAAGLELLKGVDASKDQSYFLYTLGQRELARVRFPLGGLTKAEVRRLAREAGLANHGKKDSTGICFIGERAFRAFLSRYIDTRPGPIVTTDGVAVGRHEGVALYTLGQRRGLRVGGVRGAADAPWYVVAKDTASNTLVVAQQREHPLLLSTRVRAERPSWVGGAAPRLEGPLAAKTRYRQADQPCRVVAMDATGLECEFEQPQRAVAPGQSLVLYRGEVCLGGGIVTSTR